MEEIPLTMRDDDLHFLDAPALHGFGPRRLAFRRTRGGAPDRPGVVWLGGFRSDMESTKAAAIDGWARGTGHACLRFDYSGHGQSSGRHHRTLAG
jgi:pimeloyl-ACP methyl ester carboxylesterase